MSAVSSQARAVQARLELDDVSGIADFVLARAAELLRLKRAATLAHGLGLEVAAGHGLTRFNVLATWVRVVTDPVSSWRWVRRGATRTAA